MLGFYCIIIHSHTAVCNSLYYFSLAAAVNPTLYLTVSEDSAVVHLSAAFPPPVTCSDVHKQNASSLKFQVEHRILYGLSGGANKYVMPYRIARNIGEVFGFVNLGMECQIKNHKFKYNSS